MVVAVVAANTVENQGGWEDLAAFGWGFLGGMLLGHIAWAVLVARLLRSSSRPGGTITVVLLTPVLVLALGAATKFIFPANVILLCGIPAALTWWAADPSVPGSTPVV